MNKNHTLETSGDGVGFTPGPWGVQRDLIISRATYDTICAVKRPANAAWSVLDPNAESANAKLIAAAPELLEALKSATDILDFIFRMNPPTWDPGRRVNEATLATFRAALAKALGSDPQPIPIEGGEGSSVAESGGTAQAPKSDSSEGH